MKILTTILCLISFAPVSAQSPIVGTWESDLEDEFSDELYVWQFRDDGILLQNEYYEGDLECVYAYEYSVSGDEVIIGDGLNWEYDSDTGVFVPYEDFTEEHSEVALDFAVAEGELTLSFTNESLLRQLVEELRADEEIGLDPAELGLDYDFDDEDLVISDEETIDALQSDIDDPTQDMLREAIQDLNLITDVIAQFETDFGTELPDFEFVESHREILAPPEFVLPSGQTAIAAASWGQIKGRIARSER